MSALATLAKENSNLVLFADTIPDSWLGKRFLGHDAEGHSTQFQILATHNSNCLEIQLEDGSKTYANTTAIANALLSGSVAFLPAQ